MRHKLDARLRLSRINVPGYGPGDDRNGWFELPGPGKRRLRLCASDGGGWEHVSVSVVGSLEAPSWDEMCFVKRLFWADDEGAVQYHPPKSAYVDNHPGCLHLWRKAGCQPEMPPLWMV